MQPYLGHDTHAHTLLPVQGCNVPIQTSLDSGHSVQSNIFYIIEAGGTHPCLCRVLAGFVGHGLMLPPISVVLHASGSQGNCHQPPVQANLFAYMKRCVPVP